MKLLSLRDRRARRRQRDRNTRRFREIVGVAVRYGLAERLRKVARRTHAAVAARVDGPGHRRLNNTLDRIRAGTFSVNVDHRRLDPVVNRLVLGLLSSSLYLGSSLLWSAHAQPIVHGVSLFGAAGYAISLFMTVRLLRQIRWSEQPPERRD
jgi:ubiquinone biosynthesis protein